MLLKNGKNADINTLKEVDRLNKLSYNRDMMQKMYSQLTCEQMLPTTEGRHSFGIKLGNWYAPSSDANSRSLLGDCKH